MQDYPSIYIINQSINQSIKVPHLIQQVPLLAVPAPRKGRGLVGLSEHTLGVKSEGNPNPTFLQCSEKVLMSYKVI